MNASREAEVGEVEVAAMYERTLGALRMNLEGVSEEDALREPADGANTINWLVGHVLRYRNVLLEALGREPVMEMSRLAAYGGGDGPGWSAEGAVPLEALTDALGRSQERLEVGLEAALADGASPADPDPVFLNFHESYHVGQVGYARRCLGLPGVIEPPGD